MYGPGSSFDLHHRWATISSVHVCAIIIMYIYNTIGIIVLGGQDENYFNNEKFEITLGFCPNTLPMMAMRA